MICPPIAGFNDCQRSFPMTPVPQSAIGTSGNRLALMILGLYRVICVSESRFFTLYNPDKSASNIAPLPLEQSQTYSLFCISVHSPSGEINTVISVPTSTLATQLGEKQLPSILL